MHGMSAPSARQVSALIWLGAFISGLDNGMLNASLPLIAGSFGISADLVGWLIIASLLVTSTTMIGLGRLGDRVGPLRLLNAGFVVYLIGLGASALAPSFPALLGARMFQAIGIAILSALSPGILSRQAGPAGRGRALGYYSMAVFVALALGPALGGAVAQVLNWRAIFFMTMPLTLAGIVIAYRVRRHEAAPTAARPIDWLGSGLLGVGLAAALMGISSLRWGWPPAQTGGLWIGSAATLIAFVLHERRTPAPVIDPRLLAHPPFAVPVLVSLVNFMGFYSVVFLMPFYLIEGLGYSALGSGFFMGSMAVVMAVTAPFAGRLTDRVGPSRIAGVALLILAAAILWLSLLGTHPPLPAILGGFLLAGLGLGCFAAPNNVAILSSVAPEDQGLAGGVISTSRNVGMSVGVTVGAVLFSAGAAGAAGDPAVTAAAAESALRPFALVVLIAGLVMLTPGRRPRPGGPRVPAAQAQSSAVPAAAGRTR